MDRILSMFRMPAIGILLASALLAASAVRADPVRWTHRSSATGDLPAPPPSNGQAGLRVLDVDGDGRNDYILTLWDTSAIVWYRQVGSTFETYVIEPRSINLTHGERFADIDGDGDIDLIFGQWSLGNDIYWWENPRPQYSPDTPWARHLVRDEGGNFYHDNIWGDFDGDGVEEFAAWNQGGYQLLLFEVPPNPRTSGAWPATAIFAWSAESGTSFRGIAAADVNLDGKIDLIGGGGWFEHVGAERFVFREIDPTMRTARQVAGQVIAGGPPEIVAVDELAVGPIELYVLSGGEWRAKTLIPRVPRSHTLELGDIDGDGRLDILHGEMGPLDYYGDPPPSDPTLRVLYGDGAGNFVEDVVHVGQGTLEAKLADMDGDGDLDIVGNTFRHNAPRIDIWINEGSGPPGGENAPPTVDAGPDRRIFLSEAASLAGAASDDGRPDPPGVLSIAWSLSSGPGKVEFADPAAARTTATFSVAGTYVLRLSASDGALSASDTLTVVVEDPSPPGEGRVTRGLIALYPFEEGGGSIIRDTSGAGEALDLVIADPSAVSWGAGALEVRAPVQIVSSSPAEKIRAAIAATGELTIEAWIAPADALQGGPARIVTMSAGLYVRAFTLGQGLADGRPSDVFDVRLRTTETDANGRPSVTTAAGTVSARLQHVVYARAADGEVRLSIDGELRIRSRIGGTLANGEAGYPLALADEIGGGRPWRGTYRLLAIYGVALTEAEVERNWKAGPDAGERPLFLRGDANGDGAVDLGDAVSILHFLFDARVPPSACLASLDVDGDGSIGIGDAIRLLSFLFEGGAPPASPFPGPPAPCP